MEETKTEFLKARIAPSLKQTLYKRAKENDRSISGEVAFLLKKGMESVKKETV